MNLHPTVIEKLVKIFTNYGGYREEHRLVEALNKLELSPYERQTGEQDTILVLTEDIQRHLNDLKS